MIIAKQLTQEEKDKNEVEFLQAKAMEGKFWALSKLNNKYGIEGDGLIGSSNMPPR